MHFQEVNISQFLHYGLQVPIVHSIPKPRWNFQKANWQKFSKELDNNLRYVAPLPSSYDSFVDAVSKAAKKSIPRGFRRIYIPGWNEDCENIFNEFKETQNPSKANDLMNLLNEQRRKKLNSLTEGLNITHSSRKAWTFINKLGVDSNTKKRATTRITPNNVASRLLSISKATLSDKNKGKFKHELKFRKQKLTPHNIYSSVFSIEELSFVLKEMKVRKAAGFDNIYPEMLKNCGPLAKEWLL